MWNIHGRNGLSTGRTSSISTTTNKQTPRKTATSPITVHGQGNRRAHTGPEKGLGAIKNKEGDGSPLGHVHNDNGLSGQHPQGPRKTLDGLWLQLMSAFSMEN